MLLIILVLTGDDKMIEAIYERESEEQAVLTYEFSGPGEHVVGRIYIVTPREGERYVLRVLLHHICGSKTFKDLKTVYGTVWRCI